MKEGMDMAQRKGPVAMPDTGDRDDAANQLPARQETAVAPLALPKELEGVVPADEWAVMSPEQRAATLAFLREKEQETTRGVPLNFPRIKHPTSGSNFFEVPGLDGEPAPAKTFTGVVVFKIPGRGLWLPVDAEPTKGKLPVCFSRDGIKPEESSSEVQSDQCATCQWNKWGSGKQGRGKGCRQRLNIFLLRDGDDVPVLYSAPPSSLSTFGDYAVRLRVAKIPGGLYGVATEFGLQDVKNSTGVEYKALTCKIGRRLTLAEMLAADDVRKSAQRAMEKLGVDVIAEEEPADDEVGNGHADAGSRPPAQDQEAPKPGF